MDWRVLEPLGPRPARGHQDEQAELERALRENERKLVQSIGDRANGLALGHRTVSSTQLASSQATALTAQQRSEVIELVRRQEELRRKMANSYEEQLRAVTAERDQALEEVGRIERMRLQDNKTAAEELHSAHAAWEQERRGLEKALQSAASRCISEPGGLAASSKRLALGGDDLQGLGVAELRQKLNDAQGDTDTTIQRTREIDEASYAWCLQQVRTRAVSALRQKLSEEATLLAMAARIDEEAFEQLWAVLASNRTLQQIADQLQDEADALKREVAEARAQIDELQAARTDAESAEQRLAEITTQCQTLDSLQRGLSSQLELEKAKSDAAAAKFAEVRRQIFLRAQQVNQILDGPGLQLPNSIWVELDQDPLFQDEPTARGLGKGAEHEDSDDTIRRNGQHSLGFGGRHRGRDPQESGENGMHAECKANLLLDKAARDAEAQGAERREMERCVSMLEEYATWAMRLARRSHR